MTEKVYPEAKRILVIEDDPNMIYILSETLEEWGYCVSSFVDPKQAIEAFKKKPCFLVLCDLMMPISGDKLLNVLNKLRAEQACCIITGCHDEDPMLKRALKFDNVKGVLKKPLDLKQLRNMLIQIEHRELNS